MSLEKLNSTRTHTENAERLRQQLLDYHQFRYRTLSSEESRQIDLLGVWQTARLKQSHLDLYEKEEYRPGLDFLLEDLYSPKSFSRRDDDIERIFPYMVKLLPDSLLYTVANLIELNLVTQKLDAEVAIALFQDGSAAEISESAYAAAYRQPDHKHARRHQLQLIANVGNDLEKYVHSRMINFTLQMTQGAAEMAGLGTLHDFMRRGFSAFKCMGKVDDLLTILIERESIILEQIFNEHPKPLEWQSSVAGRRCY